MQNTKFNTVVTREQFIEMKKCFKSFVNNKSNWSFKCERYGTKYAGNVMFEHYITYSILRGRAPEENSHDAQGETFAEAMKYLKSVSEGRNASWRPTKNISNAFEVEDEVIVEILKKYFN
ncbi:hypothetical protein [Vibrio crassostreae]|uniref:hypothetical protein n=1 Tax=Vibrio crassostreae TaxID=246167 RepID=UPI001B30289A|nr:hypothetical protein [Vibrio crassostreae]